MNKEKYKQTRRIRTEQLDLYYKEAHEEWLKDEYSLELLKYDQTLLYWRENKLHQEFQILEHKNDYVPKHVDFVDVFDKNVWDRIIERFDIEGLQQSFL